TARAVPLDRAPEEGAQAAGAGAGRGPHHLGGVRVAAGRRARRDPSHPGPAAAAERGERLLVPLPVRGAPGRRRRALLLSDHFTCRLPRRRVPRRVPLARRHPRGVLLPDGPPAVRGASGAAPSLPSPGRGAPLGGARLSPPARGRGGGLGRAPARRVTSGAGDTRPATGGPRGGARPSRGDPCRTARHRPLLRG